MHLYSAWLEPSLLQSTERCAHNYNYQLEMQYSLSIEVTFSEPQSSILVEAMITY